MTIPFRPRWYFFVALVSITFIGPLSLHLFIPAMSAVKTAFGVSTGMAQLAMSLPMLSMAFFTRRLRRFVRPLRTPARAARRAGAVYLRRGRLHGRRQLADVVRGAILQGAGAGCGVVLARAIARNVYGQDRVAQVIAYLTAAYVLGPMFAPPIGGR